MRFKHVLTGLMALFSGAMAAAPAPLARWSGDFTQTVKGDFTLNACGNMVALDGSSITIVPTAASGVTIDYPASKGILTVVVRYSNYSIPAADTAFLTFWGNGQNDINLSTNCNRCGFLVRSSGNAAPIYNGALWSGQEQSFPLSSEGYVAYCYNLASPKKGCLFVADWATDWSLVVGWGNIASGDSGNVIGCSIGGPRNDGACSLASFAGLTIDEIILLPGVATEEDLDAVCPPVARKLPCPTVWFSSDVGVQTNGSGAVTGWTNQGSLGAALDVSAVGDGIMLQPKCYGPQPAVVFPGGSTYTNYLKATGTSSLGLSAAAGATLFQVYQPNRAPLYGKWGNWGIQNAANKRMFTDMANDKYRVFWFQANPVEFLDDIGEMPRLMTVKTTRIVNDVSSVSVYKNTCFKNAANVGRAPDAGTFFLGYSGNESASAGNTFNGTIAEFRLYNAELSATEQFAVECELAAKYGLSVDPDGDAPIPSATLAGFTGDPVAFGTEPHGLQGPPLTNATSSVLAVNFAEAPIVGSTNVVYVAHDASEAAAMRAWVVVGAAGARAVPITLTFTGTDFTELSVKQLYFRAVGGQPWSRFEIEPQMVEGGVSFTLPAGWSSGQYCMAHMRPVPALWICGEDAVTDANGIVTSVTNRGSLAGVVELRPGSVEDGAGTIRKMSSETLFGGATYLDFDRSYLESTMETDLGLSSPFAGSAWFVVFRMPSLYDNGKSVGGLFGSASGDNNKRFAAFLADTPSNKVLRTHMLGDGSCRLDIPTSGWVGQDTLLTFSGFTVEDASRCVGLIDGAVAATQDNMWTATVVPWTGKVRIGNDALPWSANRPDLYLKGVVAEARFYNQPLIATDRAEIELELAAKYHLASSVVGAFDGAAYAVHRVDGQVFGGDPGCGTPVTPRMTWRDSVLNFSFATAPDVASRSLVYIGSDGASGTLTPNPRNRYEERTGRTWYVATSAPSAGGVFRFKCDTSNSRKWIYCLGYKADGAENFVRLPDEPVVGDGIVTFTRATLANGTYRLIRRFAYMGMTISIK